MSYTHDNPSILKWSVQYNHKILSPSCRIVWVSLSQAPIDRARPLPEARPLWRSRRLGGSVPRNFSYTPCSVMSMSKGVRTLGPAASVEFGASGGARQDRRRHREAQNAVCSRRRARRPNFRECLARLSHPGGVGGDGLTDERWGADAAGSAAGFGSAALDDGSGGAIAGARAPSGVPAVESVPDRGSGGPDLEAPRSPQQSAQARGAAASGAGDDSRVVLGFRPNIGDREAA